MVSCLGRVGECMPESFYIAPIANLPVIGTLMHIIAFCENRKTRQKAMGENAGEKSPQELVRHIQFKNMSYHNEMRLAAARNRNGNIIGVILVIVGFANGVLAGGLAAAMGVAFLTQWAVCCYLEGSNENVYNQINHRMQGYKGN